MEFTPEEQKLIERMARAACEAKGFDPDERIGASFPEYNSRELNEPLWTLFRPNAEEHLVMHKAMMEELGGGELKLFYDDDDPFGHKDIEPGEDEAPPANDKLKGILRSKAPWEGDQCDHVWETKETYLRPEGGFETLIVCNKCRLQKKVTRQ